MNSSYFGKPYLLSFNANDAASSDFMLLQASLIVFKVCCRYSMLVFAMCSAPGL